MNSPHPPPPGCVFFPLTGTEEAPAAWPGCVCVAQGRSTGWRESGHKPKPAPRSRTQWGPSGPSHCPHAVLFCGPGVNAPQLKAVCLGNAAPLRGSAVFSARWLTRCCGSINIKRVLKEGSAFPVSLIPSSRARCEPPLCETQRFTAERLPGCLAARFSGRVPWCRATLPLPPA